MKALTHSLSALFSIAIAPAVILAWPLFLLMGAGIGAYRGLAGTKAEDTVFIMRCSVDADCPPGYVCVDGRCVPENATWLFLSR